jgi:hypothetical protein
LLQGLTNADRRVLYGPIMIARSFARDAGAHTVAQNLEDFEAFAVACDSVANGFGCGGVHAMRALLNKKETEQKMKAFEMERKRGRDWRPYVGALLRGGC